MIDLAVTLKEQLRVARIASDAYENYFKQYIESRRESVLDMFQNGPNDPETLVALKHLVDSINALEASILSDIESGKLASIEMNETGV